MKKRVVTFTTFVTGFSLICSCSKSVPTQESVKEAIKGILPGTFEVVNVAPMSELNGLIEVVVKVNNQPVVFYLDKTMKHIISGSAVELASKKNLTLETQKKYISVQQPVSEPATAPAKK